MCLVDVDRFAAWRCSRLLPSQERRNCCPAKLRDSTAQNYTPKNSPGRRYNCHGGAAAQCFPPCWRMEKHAARMPTAAAGTQRMRSSCVQHARHERMHVSPAPQHEHQHRCPKPSTPQPPNPSRAGFNGRHCSHLSKNPPVRCEVAPGRQGARLGNCASGAAAHAAQTQTHGPQSPLKPQSSQPTTPQKTQMRTLRWTCQTGPCLWRAAPPRPATRREGGCTGGARACGSVVRLPA